MSISQSDILSPSQIKEKIKDQIEFSINNEKKRFTIKRLVGSFQKYVTENIIKKRKIPPYQFKVLIKFYDMSISEIDERLIEFAKFLEKSGWFISLKREKVASVLNDKIYNLQIQLCEEHLPPKYYSACFNISDRLLEKVFEKPLYKTRSRILNFKKK